MSQFKIVEGNEGERREIRRWISSFGVSQVEEMVTAWVTALFHSSFHAIEEVPFSLQVPDYSLKNHVEDVFEFGKLLASRAAPRPGVRINENTLSAVLLLHDIDKPILFDPKIIQANKPAAKQYPHGVLGAMLLKDIGFSEEVVSIVSLHGGESPLHSTTQEGWILHYADNFSADYALMTHGQTPLYQGKG